MSRLVLLSPPAIVWLLGMSQIIGYGTLYYGFSIIAGDVANTFDWPVSGVYGSFSLALLAGGMIAPLVGRRIDRHGAAVVMALGSAVAAAMLVWTALAWNPIVFTIALIATQAASALVLYDAAFAVLVQEAGPQARKRITHLTLIAGFASTLFWPLTTWLHTGLDWREILVVFAGLNLLVCLPIHLLLAAQRSSSKADQNTSAAGNLPAPPVVPPGIERRLLLLVTFGFALSNLALYAVLTQMVPMLTTLGLGASALVVSALFGPSQVLVRLVNMLLGERRHPLAAALVGLSMTPIALVVLMLTAPAAAGAVVFAVLLGFGSGLKSIVLGTLPLSLFGRASYGTRLGIMAAARQVFSAIAPFAFAMLSAWGGPKLALGAVALAGSLGLVALNEVGRLAAADRRSTAEQVGESLSSQAAAGSDDRERASS